jgi:hypothetical protein
MREITLRGGYVDTLSDNELQRWIEKEMAYATDAMKYGGKGHAQMYKDEVRKLIREQERRRLTHPS